MGIGDWKTCKFFPGRPWERQVSAKRVSVYTIRMQTPALAASCVIGFGLLLLGPSRQKEVPALEYPAPEVREEQQVIVAGARETWQLKWTAPPKPICEPNEGSLTCPCMGFAYGEGGDLYLVRLRNGAEIDRLHITPFFEEQFGGEKPLAVVQRWPPDEENDFKASEKQDFALTVAKRPMVQIMHFDDYDHDGGATEFYLQTEALPCGKSAGIVVGVSKTNLRLHAFAKASEPSKTLFMQKREWEALRDASGPTEVLDWRCADHAAGTQTTLHLHWTANGIDGTRREYACTPEDNPGELLREDPL
jgi:hypothetical protein